MNSFVALDIVPNSYRWSTELIITLLLIRVLANKALSEERIRLFGLVFVTAFVAVSLSSTYLINDTSTISLVLFLRQCLRFFLLLWILINLDLPERLMLKVHKLFIFLFLIQIPTAVIKLFLYGQGEQAIGTYAMSGGGNSIAIPMVAASFIICYHYFYKRSLSHWILIIAFFAFAVIGEKSAIFIFMPMTIIYAAIICFRYKGHEAYFNRNRVAVLLSLLIITPTVFYISVRMIPGLNNENKIWGSFSLSYLVDYSLSYNKGVSGENLSYGRLETTDRIFQHLYYDRDSVNFLFGDGPGKYVKSSFPGYDMYDYKYALRLLGISYGMTGLNYLAMQVGYIGAAIWISFFLYASLFLRQCAMHETEPYWQAYFKSMECVSFVVVLLSLTYNNVFLEDDLMSMSYMMLLAFAIRRNELIRFR
jgi:hypothetical protein